MTRFFMCLVLFFVMPPLAGLAPLDNGKAFGTWRETFMKQVLMAYGAVVGMNLVMILLPFVFNIDFFNIKIADLFVQTMFIIVGLITIKTAITTLSGLIGAEDANAAGDKINKEVGAVAGKAVSMTMGAAKVAGKAFMKATPVGIGLQAAGFGLGKAGGAIGKKIQDEINSDPSMKQNIERVKNFAGGTKAFLKGGFGGLDAYRTRRKAEQGRATEEATLRAEEAGLQDAENLAKQGTKARLLKKLNGRSFDNNDIRNMAKAEGLDDKETETFIRSIQRDGSGNINAYTSARSLRTDSEFKKFYDANGGNMSNMLAASTAANSDVARRQALVNSARSRIDAENQIINNANERLVRSYKRGMTGAGVFTAGADVAKQFMANFNTGLKQNDGYNEFLDKSGIKPKPDWAKESAGQSAATAKNTAELSEKFDALNKTLTELTNEMRQDRHKGS